MKKRKLPKRKPLRDKAGKWLPGQSGNLAGCKTGSRPHQARRANKILHQHADEIVAEILHGALSGNDRCLKMAIDRILPPIKHSSIKLKGMPSVKTIDDVPVVLDYIRQAVAKGTITPMEGEMLSRQADRQLKALQVSDLEQRLTDLEDKLSDD